LEPTSQDVAQTRSRLEKWVEAECPETLELTDVHAKLALSCGEPLPDLWADFRAKRRAKGA
jgi:hypothetical protein